MTLTELIAAVYSNYKGKASKAPAYGTTKWNDAVAAANAKKRDWARDANVKWNSLFEERTFGAVSAGTQDYGLDDDVLWLSDYVYVDDSSGNEIARFKVVKAQQRGDFSGAVYLNGLEGNKNLHFVDTINTGDAIVGGTIRAGIYFMPDDMSRAKDEVPVDDPDWLAKATAAALAINDTSKRIIYPTIVGEANDKYQRMIANNGNVPYGQENQVAVKMPSVGMSN